MSRFEVALAGVLPVAGTARALDITSCRQIRSRTPVSTCDARDASSSQRCSCAAISGIPAVAQSLTR